MTARPLIGLRERREFRDMNQKQMAEVLGLTQSQYAKFERGAVRLDIYRAADLARFLDCSIEELL